MRWWALLKLLKQDGIKASIETSTGATHTIFYEKDMRIWHISYVKELVELDTQQKKLDRYLASISDEITNVKLIMGKT